MANGLVGSWGRVDATSASQTIFLDINVRDLSFSEPFHFANRRSYLDDVRFYFGPSLFFPFLFFPQSERR